MDTKELPKTLALLTVGFAAGVVAGILFAPNIDSETTDNIKRKAGEIGDELEGKYRSEIEQLKAKISSLRGDGEQVAENISK
jgi:gas vesicle protein|tara:strand:- start:44 stop:289 length:246 start_codon:yes stop_codon:yes gene_type:complete